MNKHPEQIKLEVKPLSPYTRPKFKKGIGWMVYGKPAEIFYRLKGKN